MAFMPGGWDTPPDSTDLPASGGESHGITNQDVHMYIARQMLARRSEYLRTRTVGIKVGSWNVGNFDNCREDLKDWFLEDEEEPDSKKLKQKKKKRIDDEGPVNSNRPEGGDEREHGIYVLGLQEVVDITQTQNFLKYIDLKIALSWKAHVQAVLPAGYECIASAQLIGILMLVFVSPSIAPLISSVSTTTVGTGVMGYIGNKGGVGVRVVLGDTLRLAFVTCHLAAFSQAVDRRNWDANEILRRMWFEGVAKDVVGFERLEDDGVELNSATAGENLEKSDVLIWCGDLNYRLDLDNRDVRALLQPFMPKDLPPTHADGTSPSLPQEESPPSTPKFSPTPGEAHPSALATLEGTVESLLKHDQLHRVRREGKAFKGFKEGKISFIPTYKYDVGTMGKWDSGEKARVPSWCDRVMWRVKGSLEEERRGIDLADINKGRDRSSSVLSLPAPDEVLFETQDDSDSDEEDLVVSRAEEPVPPQKKAKTVKPMYDNPTAVVSTYFGDIRIKQERYTSHQNITSSDHKPISATFDLSFPAVDPERRAKVSADIVREVDRLENERRPVVTVVIEQPDSSVASDALEDGGNIINFGDVRFWEKKHTLIMVANTGTSQAKIRFVSRPGGKDSGVKEVICQPWMTVDVSSPAGMKKDPKRLHNAELEPGDTVNIDIYLLIESLAHARALNEKKKSLEDVLIMRVEGGRDVFLPVSAKWLYTSYGTTLKELVRIPEDAGGFRGFRKQLEERPSLKSGEDSSPTFSAPRQINHITTFLLDTLRETVATLRPDERLEEKPWFSHLGWPFVRETWHNIDSERRRKIEVGIWEALDTDADFGHVKIQRVAMTDGEEDPTKEELVEATTAVFLQWLEGLSDGIVPASLWQDIAKAGDAKTMEQVLDCLQEKAGHVYVNVFVYLAGFVWEAIRILAEKREGDKAKETEIIMAKVLDPISRALVRKPETGAAAGGSKAAAREDEVRRSWVKNVVMGMM